MADKKYKLTFTLSNGGTKSVEFTSPQGPQGPQGEKGDPGSDASVTSGNISTALGYTPANSDDVTSILARLDALEYVPIAINSFTNTVGTVEMGRTITSVTFNWSLNKTPTNLKLGTTTLSTSATSHTLSGQSITSNTSYTLTATDAQKSATKTTSISFVNGVYYGAAAISTVNSEFILSLTRSLQKDGEKAKTFSATAGSNQYIWYAVPTRYGACTFNVGGFDGGFTLVDTISFTNASGFTENYYVYRSDYANLGTQTVKVS